MDRYKFEQLLLSDEFYQYWQRKTKKDVENILGSNAAAMVGFEQRNPHHCYTLFEHVLQTVENLRSKIDCNKTDSRYLLAAAFFHDLGKVKTAREKEGRLVFYGHAVVSVQLVRPILHKMGYTKKETDIICFYIRHHDDFISFRFTQQTKNTHGYIAINEANVRRVISRADGSRDMWLKLLLLCCADAEAQEEIVYKNNIVADSKKDKLERLQEISKIIENMHEEVTIVTG